MDFSKKFSKIIADAGKVWDLMRKEDKIEILQLKLKINSIEIKTIERIRNQLPESADEMLNMILDRIKDTSIEIAHLKGGA